MQLDLDRSVNETILRCPPTLAVFTAYGLDTCCRGGLSVRRAAADAGMSLDELAHSLSHAMHSCHQAESSGAASCCSVPG